MGAIGLPGDFTLTSRFVKAAFVKMNSISGYSEKERVNQFFYILKSVAFPGGCVHVDHNQYDFTVYSACCHLDKGIYYYITYESSKINGVDMYLDNVKLINYELIKDEKIVIQNKKR